MLQTPGKYRFRLETAALHLICWWGIRILGAWWMGQAFTPVMPLQDPRWWLARLLRAAAILAIILGWTRLRGRFWQSIGLGGAHFWRNLCLGAGGTVILGLVVGGAARLEWKLVGWDGASQLATVLLICLVDVLAQQVAVFGILQRRFPWHIAAAAWISFGAAHFLIDPLPVAALAWGAGLLFAWAAYRSGDIGAGAGIHFGYYLFLAAFVGEIRMY